MKYNTENCQLHASKEAHINRSTALALDGEDELASFRDAFVIADPNTIYLDGNSLGRLPRAALERVQHAVAHEWGERLINGWNDGWIDLPARLGAKIAALIGARPDEVLVTEATSINLFKLVVAALRALPERSGIVSDEFNFPSDLYILQGAIDLLGGGRQLKLARSMDGVCIANAAVPALVDEDTALVCLTHVAFKSAYMYSAQRITAAAHAAGALALWDLSHSVGAVPLNMNADGADLAVGCTYKYLNGGPGAPGFLYVRRELQERLNQPLWGWFADRDPFAFGLDFEPAPDIDRFRVGTPPVLSMLAIEPGLDLLLEAGIERLRAKSIRQSEYLIALADAHLAPLGFSLGSPRQPEMRGSHVSLRHPEAYRIAQALIAGDGDKRMIPDFRAPDNLRLGIAPLYTTFTEIYDAVELMRRIAAEKIYERISPERQKVT